MAFNILIVDDSRTARRVIQKTLTLTELPLGEVLEASSGHEGLDALRKHWVDLVLADLNMPGMSGVEMIAEMGQDPLLAKLPVVVVSSEGDQTVLDSLAAQGVREIVRKPFNPGLLRDIMVRVLNAPAGT